VNAAYLAVAAAAILIFTACILAARKIPRRLKLKRVLIIALISLIAVIVLWLFVVIMSRPHTEEQEAPESTESTS
jgi:type VI protein secretion system component VasK